MPRVRRIKKKVCMYCADKNLVIDYKDAEKLKKFISEKGKILPRRVTGLCAKHQREVTTAIKRARQVALLPFTAE
ncbi:MAG: 30S ribosomal protein S18 [Clostridia bacterium]|nr:30S ribosomal protein S18 [Clostridia bacterium]